LKGNNKIQHQKERSSDDKLVKTEFDPASKMMCITIKPIRRRAVQKRRATHFQSSKNHFHGGQNVVQVEGRNDYEQREIGSKIQSR
jgi:chaperonin GroEL (HSP60 family)